MQNLLILGGTTEATLLAEAVTAAGIRATLSYAGRVAVPRAQPVAVRIGGFGGVAGLVSYLRDNAVTELIDATHPFADQMSRHAAEAAAITGTRLLAFVRPAWVAEPGDRWTLVPDLAAAALALAGPPRRVFLAVGRQHLAQFATQPQHHYLLRLIDPPVDLPLPRAHSVVARGPFDVAGDLALLQAHAIDTVVAKNSGGSGAEAKIIAARALGLAVILIERPQSPVRPEAGALDAVMGWLGHPALRGV